ncbi:type II secretion system protein [Candidatus Saccharibacteria bacterium]|nr:type II secretion system protein [Candidatus Saccharibacteria bacterium]
MTNIKKKGFTIIEVVLVLAIAGLIFLMVFIALPALQRSQRDTQRRNDYSMLSSAVQSYITNNGGKLTKITDCTSKWGSTSGCELDASAWINEEGTDPNGYKYELVVFPYDQLGSNVPDVSTKEGFGSQVFIVTKANCGGTDAKGNSVPKADSAVRSYAIYGHLEGAGTYCQDNNANVNDKNSTGGNTNTNTN